MKDPFYEDSYFGFTPPTFIPLCSPSESYSKGCFPDIVHRVSLTQASAAAQAYSPYCGRSALHPEHDVVCSDFLALLFAGRIKKNKSLSVKLLSLAGESLIRPTTA